MYITRSKQPAIEESLNSSFITALLGPRRVGKSTFIQHFIESNQRNRLWVSFNMDNADTRERVKQGHLQAMVEEGAQQQVGGPLLICVAIDEAQKCPRLFDDVKILYDQFKDKRAIKFVLTGSGHLTLHRLTAETLAGRIDIHQLHEFNLRESASFFTANHVPGNSILNLLESGHEQIQETVRTLQPFRRVLAQALEAQLRFGGFPELFSLPADKARIAYLANYLQTYLERDIRDLTLVSDLSIYRDMMRVLAEQTGSLRDDTALSHALGCARDTLKKYRGILGATLLYTDVYPYMTSSLKRLVKSPKGYLTSNGLISYLTGIYELDVLEKSGLIGHRFENWVLKELQVWLSADPRQSEIRFYRTSAEAEVDFVVVQAPVVYPIEVTYGDSPVRKKVSNLAQFLKQNPKAPFGIYIYNGEYGFDEQTRILFLPAWVLG